MTIDSRGPAGMEIYHFNLIDSGGHVVRERDTSCVDDWQAEAMARILLLSQGTHSVEAWAQGRLLCAVERR
jgi:hypothetical protein